MDDGFLKVLLQGTFVIGVTIFILSWFGSRLSKLFSLEKKQETEKSKTEDPAVIEQYQQEHSQNVERLQKSCDEKSQDYKERILIPREEAKRKKKEEEYARFLGPAWKGEGQALGGGQDEEGTADSALPEGRRAAHRRLISENINHEVEAAAKAVTEAKQRTKRVITLPEEPSEDSADAIFVKLRTPLGTTCSRRFCDSDTVQCLLDYMTTQGFSQKVYTISTSYPRLLLDRPEQILSELGFGSKVALNIEERD